MQKNETHVWIAETAAENFPRLWQTHAHLLPRQEQDRVLAYHFDKDRGLSLVSKILLRKMLSFYFPRKSPETWRFAAGAFGKPYIENPANQDNITFNLSHTEGLVACAVSTQNEVGVDVEIISDKDSIFDIAPSVFTSNELAALNSFTDREQQFQHFYRLWTLKEAYIKCVGKGLSIPLQDFEFHMREGGIRFKANVDAPASIPAFCSARVGDRHILSVAVHSENSRPVDIRDFSNLESPEPSPIQFDLFS